MMTTATAHDCLENSTPATHSFHPAEGKAGRDGACRDCDTHQEDHAAVKAPPTVAELAQAHADYEVQRVKRVVQTRPSFDGHPMALSEPAWQYVAELLRDAYRVGVAKGEDLRMADINTRYTLTARR